MWKTWRIVKNDQQILCIITKSAAFPALAVTVLIVTILAVAMLSRPSQADGNAEKKRGEDNNTRLDVSVKYEVPKTVAFSFDDGPDPTYTPQLLEVLREEDVRGSFFLLGKSAEAYPEVVRSIQKEGHLIGSHTYHHLALENLSRMEAKEEVMYGNRAIEKVTKEPVLYIRPPFGAFKDGMEEDWQMLPVLWEVDSMDWAVQNTDRIVANVRRDVESGDIVLFHDEYPSTVEAMRILIPELKKQGYTFVTVKDLINP